MFLLGDNKIIEKVLKKVSIHFKLLKHTLINCVNSFEDTRLEMLKLAKQIVRFKINAERENQHF